MSEGSRTVVVRAASWAYKNCRWGSRTFVQNLTMRAQALIRVHFLAVGGQWIMNLLKRHVDTCNICTQCMAQCINISQQRLAPNFSSLLSKDVVINSLQLEQVNTLMIIWWDICC